MGWFSNKLFGKRKRIDPNKINDYMQPYNQMIDKFEGWGEDMMDPMSRRNLDMQSRMYQNQSDLVAQSNQGLSRFGAQTNMSPAQVGMQAQMQRNKMMGGFGDQMQGIFQQQYGQGLGLMQGVMGARQGEGERLSNMHIKQVEAHNARRQQNMGLFTSLVGAGIGNIGNYKG